MIEIMWRVNLTAAEQHASDMLALKVFTEAWPLTPGGNNYRGTPEQALSDDQLGFSGEFSYAKFRKLPYPVAGHLDETRDGEMRKYPDFWDHGYAVEVKTVRRVTDHMLIKKNEAYDDWLYVLVRQNFKGTYTMVGWGWGRDLLEGKEFKDELKNRRPAAWIDQHELNFDWRKYPPIDKPK